MTTLFGEELVLSATPEHPFYVPAHRGYIDLRDLEPGARLRLSDGGEAILRDKRVHYQTQEVFNLQVSGTHSYFVREPGGTGPGVLVHNARYDPCGPLRKTLDSLAKQLIAHILKLDAYMANPFAHDNRGHLASASDDAVRERIIAGRKRHLEAEIATFKKNFAEARGKGSSLGCW